MSLHLEGNSIRASPTWVISDAPKNAAKRVKCVVRVRGGWMEECEAAANLSIEADKERSKNPFRKQIVVS